MYNERSAFLLYVIAVQMISKMKYIALFTLWARELIFKMNYVYKSKYYTN